MTVAAIGRGTARALAELGITADILAEEAIAESFAESLAGLPVKRALLARAAGGRDVLGEALRERGAEVDLLVLYETVAEPVAEHTLRAAREADYITFTSSSTVDHFLTAAGDGASGEGAISAGTRIVSIGPVTSATLRSHGLEPHVEADRHDVDGVIAALLADAIDSSARR